MTAERFVVDTNVLISAALRPASVPRAVVQAIRYADGILLFSDETFGELHTRFRRSRFDRHVSREAREAFLAQLQAVSEWVSIVNTKLGCRDPEDDRVSPARAGMDRSACYHQKPILTCAPARPR